MSIKDLDPLTPSNTDLVSLGDDEIRALKTALQACFPELEGLVSNGSAVGVNPPDAATWSSLFTRLADAEDTLSAISGDGTVPVGAIMMWTGAQIPVGWIECNGANGTPDLRGRMPIGVTTNDGNGPQLGDGYGLTGWADVGGNPNIVNNTFAGGGTETVAAGAGQDTAKQDHTHAFYRIPPYAAVKFIMYVGA